MKLPVLLAAAALAICLTGCSHVQTDATPSATSETAGAAATATPAATPATSAEPVCAEVGTILPETADAGRSYVDETLFIGDSNTARYLLYANETGTAFTSLNNNIGVVSMGVGSITSLKCEKFKGSSAMYTVPDAVAMLKPKRIIICYGTNNLSGSSTDATNYIKTYLQGLQAIQTAWPYCDIIVSAIPPLDRQRENTNLTMTQVDAYNAALVQMCEENGFKFLNSAEVLRDDATGWAKKDYTLSDGVHLSKEAVTAYFTYVRTHAYAAEDRRPQPLGTIPTPDGVPANLINKDPIAVRGAKVPLEFVAANGGKLSGTTSQLVKKGGTAAAVTAVPDEGFVFAGWTASSGGSYSSATISFTMPQNADAGGVVLTANFKADAHEHNYAEIEDTRVNPTCTNNGSAKYKCTICGEVIEKELPALGHDWDGGVRSGDYITYYCRREGCSETKTEESQHTHTYDEGIVTQAATCGAPGVLTRTCAICGQQIQEEIPATGQHQYGEAVRDGDYLVMNCIICGHSESTYSPLPPENPAPVDPPPVESPQPETPVVPSPEQPEASSVPTQEPTSTENTSGIASSSSETTTE
ncbi:GDSL-type esterase/lipase family protein [Gemmiger formicilis]|uniref:GDSL-type esterase/lipase family protein n=1 Tax=Gemmiger formicilis TaxID=745368 RepID=UPI0022DF3B12|nr:GDSL-type esterase/lipase family protein [Gemmiger formicilis]UYI82754.1 MAG: GDSL-type esterase/lipase family protein [Oscillospiraceae bacterium]